MKKKLGKSDPWLTSRLFHRPCEPEYNIVDCQISEDVEKTSKLSIFAWKVDMGTLWIGSHMCATQLKRLPGKSFIPRRWVPIFREKFSLKRVWCLKQLLVGLRNLLRGKFSSFTMLSNLKLRLWFHWINSKCISKIRIKGDSESIFLFVPFLKMCTKSLFLH